MPLSVLRHTVILNTCLFISAAFNNCTLACTPRVRPIFCTAHGRARAHYRPNAHLTPTSPCLLLCLSILLAIQHTPPVYRSAAAATTAAYRSPPCRRAVAPSVIAATYSRTIFTPYYLLHACAICLLIYTIRLCCPRCCRAPMVFARCVVARRRYDAMTACANAPALAYSTRFSPSAASAVTLTPV